MSLQPMVVVPPDAELWATGYFRDFLADRPEAYAAGVKVGKTKPPTNSPRMVTVRRDGGEIVGLIDNPRLAIRVWADKDQEASDLARLLVAAIKASPGDDAVLSVVSVFGPSPIPDSSQPQYLVNAELKLRCSPLTPA